MVLVVKDRIKDTSSTSGSGTITLDNSPPAGYQAFSTLGNGSTTYYAIQGSDNSFEIGLGTYNANTLTRTTILSSSNNGVIINLPSGSHTVWVDYPAAKAYLSEEGIDKSFTSTAGIAAGRPVILNSAGTVTQVANIPDAAISPGLGTVATTSVSEGIYNSNAFGKDGQRVTVYRGASLGSGNYDISIRVATVSTTDLKTITWSGLTTLTPSSTGNVRGTGIIYDAVADKYVLIWKGASDYLHGCTLTVSGTGATATVSAGTQIVIDSNALTGYTNSNCLSYDTVNSFSIVSFSVSTPKTCSLSISGTNLTAGTVATVSNNSTDQLTLCAWNKYHGKVIYMYRNSSEDLYYNVGTSNSNGTITVSSGNEGLFDNVINYKADNTVVSCDPSSGETLVVIQDGDNKKGQGGDTVWSSSGTLSGTTITFGSLTQISNIVGMAGTYSGRALEPIEDGKLMYVTSLQTTSPVYPYRGVYCIITVSGTSTSYGAVTPYSPQYSYGIDHLSLGVDFAKTQGLIVYRDTTNGYLNGITLLQTTQNGDGSSTNLTASNYLGVASTSASANASVNINIPGSINNDQTGLTIGKNYYTSSAGVISTTLSPNFVGKAISSTQLLLEEKKGNSMDGLSNGAITKGKPVVMQADGDVAQAKETSSSITFAQGSATEIEEGWLDQRVISYDVNENKFLVAYRDQDQSVHGFCKVLSVSGTTVSYGSESSAFNSNSTNVIDSVYDPESGNHVIFYQNGSNQYGYGVVASISGTSVTFGTPVAFNSANTHYRGTCFYDSTNKKVVWVGGHFSGSYLLKAVVGTVSGTSISFGSLQDSGVSSTDYYSSAYDTNSSIGVYAYHDSGSDGYMGTLSISGTSITWNTPVNFYGTTNVSQMFDSMTYDSVNKKIVHTFRDTQNGKLMSVVATPNGTSLSLGTPVEVVSNANGGNTMYHSVVGTLQGVVALVFRDGSNGYLKYLQGTVSGTSISFAGGVTLDSTNIEETPAIAYDSNNYGIVTSYSDQSTHDLWAVAVTPSGTVLNSNLTAANYLGIASDTVANNENATIQTQGAVNSDQSSLTAGQLYYVQTDGTLSTTAGSPSVIAGIATSATTLLVTKS